jgi:hypothetical protein
MASRTLTSVPDSTPEFEEKELTVRGTTYRLRELTSGEYDDAMSVATKPGSDDLDMVVFVKMMLLKSLIEPKLSDAQIEKLPYKTTRVLRRAVQDLHWSE